MSILTSRGEDAARAYIQSLADPDARDAARVHLAWFLAHTPEIGPVLQLLDEVENLVERLDGILTVVRVLNSHHRLHEALKLLRTMGPLAEGCSEQYTFLFSVAVELYELGMRGAAVAELRRAIQMAQNTQDHKTVMYGALRLARWGVQQEPEEIISTLPRAISREYAQEKLKEIRMFALEMVERASL